MDHPAEKCRAALPWAGGDGAGTLLQQTSQPVFWGISASPRTTGRFGTRVELPTIFAASVKLVMLRLDSSEHPACVREIDLAVLLLRPLIC